ncbi:MBL fold metallo-hydrolase [Candidatus Woesearchaeota archaeon]|nr:MBL fold metallo-hydrolase [Candidatus Woesearchaeota archaeon]
MTINILTCKVGELKTNCYLLIAGDECLLIDPGSNNHQDIATIQAGINDKKLRAVIYTHNHFDHVMGGYYFKNVPHYMHQADINTLEENSTYYQAKRNLNIILPEQIEPLQERMNIGAFSFQIIHTPGHSKGGVCLLFAEEKFVLTGDTLFCGTCGRTDLPHASTSEMKASLKLLAELDDELSIYPGHGRPSSIGAEQKSIQALIEQL